MYMCIIVYVLRYKQCLGIYVYYIIIIYTVVSFERRGRHCIYIRCARRLATTRAANKYLIFQTTSQPELLAAVFDPIIKSFSSCDPTPTPRVPSADGRYCWVYVRESARGWVHALPEGARREFETRIHVKCTTQYARTVLVLAAFSSLRHHLTLPSTRSRLPARRCDDSSLIVPAFNLPLYNIPHPLTFRYPPTPRPAAFDHIALI